MRGARIDTLSYSIVRRHKHRGSRFSPSGRSDDDENVAKPYAAANGSGPWRFLLNAING